MTTLIRRVPAAGEPARSAAPLNPLRLPKKIVVNGTAISREAIGLEAQNHPAEEHRAAFRAAAEALVIRELLLQEAHRLGIVADPARDAEGRRETEEEALIRGLVDREVKVPVADEEACRRYYERNRRRFSTPPLHEVRHILIPAPADDGDARRAARARADVLLAALATDPGSFAILASEASACPSRAVGGSLGQIGPGQTVPEFEEAVAAMTPGRVHPEPVETRYGVHVVELVRRVDGRELPFEAVRERIAAYLGEAVRRRALAQYVALLVGRAEIKGIEMAGAASPLVQ